MGVFDAENELPAGMLAGHEVVVEGRAHAADVQRTGRRWCESHPHAHPLLSLKTVNLMVMSVTTRRERRERELRRRQREKHGGHTPSPRGGGGRRVIIGVGIIPLFILSLLGLP